MFKKNLLTSLTSIFAIVGIFVVFTLINPQQVFAAALTTLSDTQSSLKISALSDHTIQFVTPSGVAAAGTIQITFPAGYSMGSFAVTNVDFATSTSATCSGFADATLAAGASGLT
jgi:hypothetical protein